MPMTEQRRCSVPVGLIVFNRPDLTARVVETVRRARPPQLFIIADGPRDPSEEGLCRAAREAALQVDWPCKVKTEFAPSNLGCGRRVATGIDWIFSNVEEAIILEDDCVPAPSFFNYCEALLRRYRDEPRVMHIGGSNFLPETPLPYSYYFTRYTQIWGWATWRRAWQNYSYSLAGWPDFKASGQLASICSDPVEAAYWSNKLDAVYYRKRATETWDYQWNYSVWSRGGLAISPSINLISNEGFRPDATHTRISDPRAGLEAGDIWDLRHPPSLEQHEQLDRLTFDHVLGGAQLRRRQKLSYKLSKPARLIRNWRQSHA